MMDAKLKGEDYLRKSGVPYTIVRPGGLSNDLPGQVRLVAGECRLVWSGRHDLAVAWHPVRN